MGKHQKNAKTTTDEQQTLTGVAHGHEKKDAHSAESNLVHEMEIFIKQEPLNQDSSETGSDVHNSQIDVAKREVCGNSSDLERPMDVSNHSEVTEIQVKIEPMECTTTEIKETPRSRLTSDQRWIMVEFLRRNKAIILGRCAGPVAARQRAKVLAQMAKTLNSTVDGAVKTPDKWLSLEPLPESASLPVVISYKDSQPASDTNIEPSTDAQIPLNELNVKQNKVKKLSCELCKYQCGNKNTLERHMKTHIGEKLYTCKHCDYEGAHFGDLELHLKTHSEKTPYSCKDCDYKCAQIGTFNRHLRFHTGEKPHTCKLCKCKFSTTGNLNRHIKTHADEKPYTCDHCGLKFSRSGHLETHMRIHTGEKPYTCKHCDYKGTQISALKRHLRTHTGEKPYSCKYCGFRSAQIGGLNRHLRTHTGEKPYPCEQCDYKSSTTSDLKRHNMRNHKETLHL